MSVICPITVVLADDHAMVRESLARVLNDCPEISVVGQVGNGIDLVRSVAELSPQCLVMDYSMPDHDAIETIQKLAAKSKSLKTLVLTVHENVHYAVRTLEAGANGYLIKSAAVEELVDAIRSIHTGDVYISKKISAEVWNKLRRPKKQREGLEGLSQREFEVLRCLGGGATLNECSQQLKIGVSTVSTYRSRILEKLNLNSTSEMVRYAIENKVLEA